LVGHDWGGIVAWFTAARHPERVSHLVTIASPHPSLLQARPRRRSRRSARPRPTSLGSPSRDWRRRSLRKASGQQSSHATSKPGSSAPRNATGFSRAGAVRAR
jgi:pimeloyl-ACP methyl ester carboxylesterase